MNRRETIEFIVDLSKGIDPLTKEPLINDTVLNRGDVVRALYDVLNLLRASNNVLYPFKISSKDGFSYEEKGIRDFVNEINDLRDEGTSKMNYKVLLDWLTANGYLYIPEDGQKRPTAKGLENGIVEYYIEKRDRNFYQVKYTQKIQEIIIDNLLNGNIKKH